MLRDAVRKNKHPILISRDYFGDFIDNKFEYFVYIITFLVIKSTSVSDRDFLTARCVSVCVLFSLQQNILSGFGQFESQQSSTKQCSAGQQDGDDFSDSHKWGKDGTAQDGRQFTQCI